MRRKLALAAAASLVVLLLAIPAVADELDVRARAVAKQLQCPVCESVSVADSPAELAVQMRGVIRAKLEAGESEPQILSYFVDRYGDGILVEPPRRGVSLLVWLGPIVALLLGTALTAIWLRASRSKRVAQRTDTRETTSARASPDLEAARRELGSLRGTPER